MANLLDRASIVLTPTAYNNGEALCIKPDDGSGDFQFSRNSAATRVNAQGLVENVQILSSNLVQNGDFSEEGAEEVSNGSFTNGSTDWALENTWTIGDGVANGNGANGSEEELTQSFSIVSGKTYKVVYDVLNYVSGTIRFQFSVGGTLSGITRSSNGTFTEYVVASGNHTTFKFRPTNFNGSVTNISVKEVGQNWVLGTGWSIGNGELIGVNSFQSAYQDGTTSSIIGFTAKITFEIKNYTSGTIIAALHNDASQPFSGNGVYSATITKTSNFNRLQFLPSSFNGSITNISVIEITTDTSLPRINYEGFSYDGSGNVVPDSGCGSWLFEPQSTNLITQSELFSDASWTKIGTSVTNGFTSPNGTNNACKLVEDTSDGSHAFYNSNFSSLNGQSYTYSLFVKYNGRQWFRLWGQYGNSNFSAYFDIQNGLLGSKDIGMTSKIEDYGNGWYRISATATTDGTASRFRGYLAEADNDPFYQGDGTSGVYIWGAQAETNNISSYIPTSGSQRYT